MLIIFRQKATSEQVAKAAEDFSGYIKVVVDVQQAIVAAGGQRHVEGEQALLAEGSKQDNLWGGGLDLETREIDYNSIINLRPRQENPSRDILDSEIRKKFDTIVKTLLL